MITIVGTRIYLHEGDDCSFRVVYRNPEGDILNFRAEDSLSLTIRDRDTRDIILRKESTNIKSNGESVSIITFSSTDEKRLCRGDYIYDLVLDTAVGSRHVLIDRAYFNVIDDPAPDILEGEFDPHRLVSMYTERICLSTTPLICNFVYTEVIKEEVDGTLILYDRIPVGEPEINDDTLILFDAAHTDPSDEKPDDTLILF